MSRAGIASLFTLGAPRKSHVGAALIVLAPGTHTTLLALLSAATAVVRASSVRKRERAR